MPQVSIEHSDNLGSAFDAAGFARAVHGLLVAHADAELANCKTRLVEHKVVIGDGKPSNAMVHVDLRVLPGRSDAQKRQLGSEVLAALEKAMSALSGFDLQLTVEVRELDGANYHKKRLAT
jgi:5-carboxymethyl-2-hydroxymuconate isomerase